MKVRRYKLRKPRAPRNPVAIALQSKRGGAHKKTNKALRRADNARLASTGE